MLDGIPAIIPCTAGASCIRPQPQVKQIIGTGRQRTIRATGAVWEHDRAFWRGDLAPRERGRRDSGWSGSRLLDRWRVAVTAVAALNSASVRRDRTKDPLLTDRGCEE